MCNVPYMFETHCASFHCINEYSPSYSELRVRENACVSVIKIRLVRVT